MRQLLYISAFLFLFFQNPVEAQPKEYGSLLVTEVVKVCDGDTFKVNIDDVHPIIGENISVRIYGIDTPELKSKKQEERDLALLAKQYLEAIIERADVVELVNIRRGKYFRIVADVYVDGESVAEKLLQAGLAQPYDGKGAKPSW